MTVAETAPGRNVLSRNTLCAALALAFAASPSAAPGVSVAFDMVGSASQNLISHQNAFAGAFSSAGDGFEKYRRGVSASIPFAVLDDSLSIFPADSLGIVDETNGDEFFGVTDTQNADNDGPVSASWTFDIGGATDLGLALDAGAMGDFEASDSFSWAVSIDGGPQAEVLAAVADEAGSQTYTLAGGASFTLSDPLAIGGVPLSNVLQTFAAPIAGTGNTLVLTFTAQTDGGAEALAFQNLRITSGEGPEPEPLALSVPEIQGAGHFSPYAGERVRTQGAVTAIAFNGFYLQDLPGDGNDDTSDGIFVFGGGSGVAVGDLVSVEASVSEFVPGGAATGNLSITQLGAAAVTVTGALDPASLQAVVIGASGRVPPNATVISDDETDPPINLQNAAEAAANPFDPAADGLDFYESLEGMLVRIEAPVAVSATRTFSPFSSEFFVLANDGGDVAPRDARNRRGGIDLQPDRDNRGDQNPERVQVQLDGTLYPGAVPAVTVGDRLGDVTGVVGYSFGNFEVNATQVFDVHPGGLARERTRFRALPFTARVASYNVLNLSPDASDANQRATLAGHIAHNLRAPDVVALQEIQDNSGETDDGVTDADETLRALADAIVAAGGPAYAFVDVAPADGSSGGVPGGNIRNAFLYDPARVRLQGFQSLTPAALAGYGVSNPDAFVGTRDPLLATFSRRGRSFTVINNHLSSRFGSTPVFGAVQPFVQAGEDERGAQTGALNEVVDALLARERHARILVLGDLNTFQFTDEIAETLPGSGDERVLFNLVDRLRDDEVYTFNFEGNSQVLDHVLVSRALRRWSWLDIVHVNVDYPRVDDSVGSDHEPLVVQLLLPPRHGHGNRHDD